MFAVSVISTMKVDWPRDRSSLAPMRVKMRSTKSTRTRLAGTNEPVCASNASSATCRIYVLLPAMFGPVMTAICWASLSSCVSFGTNGSPISACSSTGWRPSSICSMPSSRTSGQT